MSSVLVPIAPSLLLLRVLMLLLLVLDTT